MKTVVAAIDDTATATPVLRCARILAPVFGARAEALHVRTGDGTPPHDVAAASGLELRVCEGEIVDCLIEAGRPADAVALVLGARDTPETDRPLGVTALAIATASLKPIVVVPPDADPRMPLSRVLVPLEGTLSTSLAPQSLIELAGDADLDVIALHVIGPENPLAFHDQPQYEQEVWGREFLARYCPWGIDVVRFETRIGRREELIPRAAREFDCDLVVLGWFRHLGPGRARVVSATLRQAGVPVMLVPLPNLGAPS